MATPFQPIPYVNDIPPNELVNILNILINFINQNNQAIGFGDQPGVVTRRQFLQAIANQNLLQTVVASIPANANSPIYVEYISANSVAPGDTLATAVQTALGYSNAQMAALFIAAASLTP